MDGCKWIWPNPDPFTSTFFTSLGVAEAATAPGKEEKETHIHSHTQRTMKHCTTYSKLYLTEGSGSNDLIRFLGSVHNVKNGSNQISSQAAYVLADNGASEVYMSMDMANKLKAQGAVTRDAGWIEA